MRSVEPFEPGEQELSSTAPRPLEQHTNQIISTMRGYDYENDLLYNDLSGQAGDLVNLSIGTRQT